MRTTLCLAFALLLSGTAHAATGGFPLSITHTGYLLEAADVPVTTPAISLTFAIYDQSLPVGTQVLEWAATCDVAVVHGYYAALLGEGACAGSSLLETSDLPAGGARWLQVSVGSIVLMPRLAISPAPTAASALDASKLGGALPATFHDAALLTGVAPASVLGSGASGITTVGTIATGTWQGTKVADAYLESAALWHGKLAGVAHDATLVGDGTAGPAALAVNVGTGPGAVAAGDDARFGRWTGAAEGLDAAAGRVSLALGTAATADANAFATAAQGSKADAALPAGGGTVTGSVNFPGSGVWTSAGAVGIGVSSPVAKLDIHNASETGYMTALVDVATKSALKIRPDANNTTSFYFGHANTGAAHVIQAANGLGTTAYDLAFNPFGGKVGIGTVTPATALDVNGFVNASQGLSVGTAPGVRRAVMAGGRKTVTVGTTVDLVASGHTASGTLHLAIIGNSGQAAATYVAERAIQIAYGSGVVTAIRNHSLGTQITGAAVVYDNSGYKLTVLVSGPDATADLVWSFHGIADGSLLQL